MEQGTIPPEPTQNQAATAGLPGIVPPTGRHDPRNRLGDVIIELGFADRELIEEVMNREAESERPMGELLVQSGLVTSTQLAQALAERNSLDFVDLNRFNVDTGRPTWSAPPTPSATARSPSPSSATAPCSSPRRTPRTSWPSTTSR